MFETSSDLSFIILSSGGTIPHPGRTRCHGMSLGPLSSPRASNGRPRVSSLKRKEKNSTVKPGNGNLSWWGRLPCGQWLHLICFSFSFSCLTLSGSSPISWKVYHNREAERCVSITLIRWFDTPGCTNYDRIHALFILARICKHWPYKWSNQEMVNITSMLSKLSYLNLMFMH